MEESEYITKFYIYIVIGGVLVGLITFLTIKDIIRKKPFGIRFTLYLVFTMNFGISAILTSISSIKSTKEILEIDGSGVLLNQLKPYSVNLPVFYLIVSILTLCGYALSRRAESDKDDR
ncbi:MULTISPECIES: hypothetical protein [Halobacillus]|uniref:hypothetical protein n=1 Tax=Halobacillus TaxID=45667 RepID=UPI00048981BF|nr:MULTISPECIES: hypothetical protein [Halobacillus]